MAAIVLALVIIVARIAVAALVSRAAALHVKADALADAIMDALDVQEAVLVNVKTAVHLDARQAA